MTDNKDISIEKLVNFVTGLKSKGGPESSDYETLDNWIKEVAELITNKQKFEVLNVASGPCRDISEYLSKYNTSECEVCFDCVEQDENAINYAEKLCKSFTHNVNFIKQNVYTYVSDKKYDLVWSSGLFDYFTDKRFEILLKKFLTNVKDGGELVIGNFSNTNKSKDYMLLFDWLLFERSKEKLETLAKQCGVLPRNIFVGQEEEGVNLFLHVRNLL